MIPDPTQLMECRINQLADLFVDESTCMNCGKKVNYDLVCPSPTGDGPGLCMECTMIPTCNLCDEPATHTLIDMDGIVVSELCESCYQLLNPDSSEL